MGRSRPGVEAAIAALVGGPWGSELRTRLGSPTTVRLTGVLIGRYRTTRRCLTQFSSEAEQAQPGSLPNDATMPYLPGCLTSCWTVSGVRGTRRTPGGDDPVGARPLLMSLFLPCEGMIQHSAVTFFVLRLRRPSGPGTVDERSRSLRTRRDCGDHCKGTIVRERGYRHQGWREVSQVPVHLQRSGLARRSHRRGQGVTGGIVSTTSSWGFWQVIWSCGVARR